LDTVAVKLLVHKSGSDLSLLRIRDHDFRRSARKRARDELQVRACREERLDNPRPDSVQVLVGLGDVEVATPFNVGLLPPAAIEPIPLQRFRVVLLAPRLGVGETSDKLCRARDRKSTRLNSSHVKISYA